jgi:cyclophilin family peptidyl-prolyl cis-trans isomerase
MTIDTSKTYLATVKTDAGTFVITLDAKEAPIAVNNFVFLAEHKFYNCVIFHRVIPGFVVQGGDPTGTGEGGPGYQFTEAGPPAAKTAADQYPLDSVAMANSSSGSTDPSTNGSQFFIVTGSSGEQLPPDYVLFGQVTSGLSVVQQINNDGSSAGVPPTVTHRMLSVTITES